MNITLSNPFRTRNVFEGISDVPLPGYYHSSQSMVEELAQEHPVGNHCYALLASAVAAFPKDDIAILDVGGGLGAALPYLQSVKKNIRLIIQEIPEVVAEGKKRGLECVTECSEKVDIIFFGSSFQYLTSFPNPLNASMVIFGYTPLSVVPFHTLQVNMKGRKIPTTIHDKDDLQREIERLGFTLVYEERAATKVHFDNFPAPQSESGFYNLIFKK